ncbi:excalibur calcium-binding domain-containing protein [Corynebacterium macginleyi]|uniref:excalibur calcium-binding domain-containing protein n=1 Tax=Corynebacterium macginleyi TaxID=38290 RepID=UPI00398A9128
MGMGRSYSTVLPNGPRRAYPRESNARIALHLGELYLLQRSNSNGDNQCGAFDFFIRATSPSRRIPPHDEENPTIDQVPDEHEEPVLAPEEQLAPELVYQQPAPVEKAPLPSGGGGSCAAIGHKVYRGDGLYSRKLDRDGDGVGCESYPG